MGASGPGPLDNDTAGDFFGDIEKRPITELIEDGLASKDCHEVRAAAWLLRRIYDAYPIEDIERVAAVANRRLSDVLEDDEWIERWDKPNDVRWLLAGEVAWFGKMLGMAHQKRRKDANAEFRKKVLDNSDYS